MESAEVVLASQVAVLGMSQWNEAPEQTQNILERLYFPDGLGKFGQHPEQVCVLRDIGLV